jgi:general secretion pathway protein G
MLRNQGGFTLIELLIVVAIIGIIASIAIPNLLSAVDRSKQKRSMADMRTIGTALEAYATDHNFYPVSPADTPIGPAVATLLQPTYTQAVPLTDGWDQSFRYGTESDGTSYTLRSWGKDAIKNGTLGATSDFNCDIVFQQGRFIAWPEGIQT